VKDNGTGGSERVRPVCCTGLPGGVPGFVDECLGESGVVEAGPGEVGTLEEKGWGMIFGSEGAVEIEPSFVAFADGDVKGGQREVEPGIVRLEVGDAQVGGFGGVEER